MKIKREVDGKMLEFELTDLEALITYHEYEHKTDIETVVLYTKDNEVPDDKIDEVANYYRNLYDIQLEYASDLRYDCVRDAVKEVLGNDD